MKKKVAVVGAGTMGVGVALDLALNDHYVVLKDISEDVVKKAYQSLRAEFRGLKMLKLNLAVSSFDELIKNINITHTYDDFNDVDIVIENVSEQWPVKKKVYLELASVCSDSTIYMVNTSCIPITEIANLMPKPGLVVGTHFMNPVPMKKTVEMIRGFHTSNETITCIKDFLKTLSKTAIVVEDSPGFVTNRLSHLFMNEAAFLVLEQVASPKDIDTLFKECYGHSMGPLETADLIGLDTVVDSLAILYDRYQDPKFRCCSLLKKMVVAGNLGRKSGKGFYNY